MTATVPSAVAENDGDAVDEDERRLPCPPWA